MLSYQRRSADSSESWLRQCEGGGEREEVSCANLDMSRLGYCSYLTCSTCNAPAGNGRRSVASGLVRSSQAAQSSRSRIIIWRSCIGATSGPGSVVRSVKASPVPSGVGRQRPAKQNHASPTLVNFHFDFVVFLPVNSKKWDAGAKQRPTGKRRPSDLKLITGGPLGLAGGNPQRNTANSFLPSSSRRMTGAGSVGQISARGSRVRGSRGPLHRDARLAERCKVVAIGDVIPEVVAHGRREKLRSRFLVK